MSDTQFNTEWIYKLPSGGEGVYRIILAVLMLISLASCRMTNEEIVDTVKYCTNAGMGYRVSYIFPNDQVMRIECDPTMPKGQIRKE